MEEPEEECGDANNLPGHAGPSHEFVPTVPLMYPCALVQLPLGMLSGILGYIRGLGLGCIDLCKRGW